MTITPNKKKSRGQTAFTLAEVLISMMVFGATFVALYAGISASYTAIRGSRERLRASQIVTERFEAIRLFNWSYMLGNGGMAWTNTTEYYDPSTTNGLSYNVGITFANGPTDVSYSNNLKLVIVTVSWSSGGMKHTNQMASYVAYQGLQGYVY